MSTFVVRVLVTRPEYLLKSKQRTAVRNGYGIRLLCGMRWIFHIMDIFPFLGVPGSSVSIVIELRTGNQRIRSSFPGGSKRFVFPPVLQDQSRHQLDLVFDAYRRFFTSGYSGRGVILTNNFYLLLSLRMSRTISLFPHMPSWCGQGQFCFHHYYISGLLPENSELKQWFKNSRHENPLMHHT